MRIIVPHGKCKEIEKTLLVSQPTIRKALRFRTRTLLSNKIRKMALEQGGEYVEYKQNKKNIE
jgi:hypothetical protein